MLKNSCDEESAVWSVIQIVGCWKQSSSTCGNFIGEFQFNLDFTRVSSQLPPGGYCGYFHRWSGCCVTPEGVFGSFMSFLNYLIIEVDADVPTTYSGMFFCCLGVCWQPCRLELECIQLWRQLSNGYGYLIIFFFSEIAWVFPVLIT